jgi:BirA family transcriptional regulator, biotin operon repressor / biotin---[acetyl-CoA-carboxylase] ligase
MTPTRRRSTFTNIRWFDELDSTNTWLLEEAASGCPEGTVVVADRQSAGRGRLGRTWSSEPGSGLLTSILFRPSLEPSDLFSVAALVSLGALDAVQAVAGVRAGAKWPNDLVVDDAKLAGVLSETTGVASGALAVVVGIGINISWPMPGAVADELGATCLESLSGQRVEREALLEALLDGIEARRALLDDGPGRASIVHDLAARTVTVGRSVRVELAGESFTGTATGLDARGQLVVDTPEGSRTVSAGDVVHLR